MAPISSSIWTFRFNLSLRKKTSKYTEKDATAIRKHFHHNDHCCSVDNFDIVGIAVNDFHLKLKESSLRHVLTSYKNRCRYTFSIMILEKLFWNNQ